MRIKGPKFQWLATPANKPHGPADDGRACSAAAERQARQDLVLFHDPAQPSRIRTLTPRLPHPSRGPRPSGLTGPGRPKPVSRLVSKLAPRRVSRLLLAPVLRLVLKPRSRLMTKIVSKPTKRLALRPLSRLLSRPRTRRTRPLPESLSRSTTKSLSRLMTTIMRAPPRK